MSDSDSPSPPPKREGFERRWIKDANYTGPERRSGHERRRHPPSKDTEPAETDAAKESPSTPTPPGKFKPYRP